MSGDAEEGSSSAVEPLLAQDGGAVEFSPTRQRQHHKLHQYHLPRRKRKRSGVWGLRARAKLLGLLLLLSVVAGGLLFARMCPDYLCLWRGPAAAVQRHISAAQVVTEDDLSDFIREAAATDGHSEANIQTTTVGVNTSKNENGWYGDGFDYVLPHSSVPVNFINYDDIQDGDFEFDMTGNDVMVFLHIQKTGGTTFGKHLVQDVDLEKPCQCKKRKRKNRKNKTRQYDANQRRKFMRCDCFRPGKEGNNHPWLFSRYTLGWKCGLHADWTELTDCVDTYMDGLEGGHVDQRRYFYVTFLRDPVARYLSEFKHVQRGATWRQSRHSCGGREPTEEELPSCYPPGQDDWLGVSLDEFLGCGSNLAANRQTRMLADLRLVNCYNRTGMSPEERDRKMLASAKRNLLDMAYFGLTELQAESQAIFEDTFSMDFVVSFEQFDDTTASKTRDDLGRGVKNRIKELNSLDIKLYKFARDLLLKRFRELKEEEGLALEEVTGAGTGGS